MSHFEDSGDIFLDSIQALEERCDRIARESYDLKRFPELADIDSEVLIGEMRILSEQLFSVYYSVWQAQLERKRLAE